ncbi:ubiquitin-like modifier activating enzyme 6, putative, partial [Ichthyophthirius multifiliis]
QENLQNINLDYIVQQVREKVGLIFAFLPDYDQELMPFLIFLSSKFQDFGEFLISYCLQEEQFSCQEIYSQLIMLIIINSQSTELLINRLVKLFDFIIRKKENLVNIQNYLHAFVNIIRFLNTKSKLEKQKINKTLVQSFDLIYQIFQIFENQQFLCNKSLIKFIINLLDLPSCISIEKNVEIMEQTLNYLWQNAELNPELYDVISVIIKGGKKQCFEWFKREKIIEEIIEKHQKYTGINNKYSQTNSLLNILVSLIENCEIKEQIILKEEFHIKIYKKYLEKSKQSNINYSLLVEFMKKCVIENDQEKEKLIKIMKKDIIYYQENEFISKFFLPFLKSMNVLLISFHVFDSISSTWVFENKTLIKILGNNKLNNFNIQNNNNSLCKISSSLLSNRQNDIFSQTIKDLTEKSGLYKVLRNQEWILTLSQNQDSMEALVQPLKKKVLTNAPFVIIIQGSNAGNKCVCGVFSSQGMQPCAEISGDFANEENYVIPKEDDCFIFYYEDNYEMHFNAQGDQWGNFSFSDDFGASLSFKYNKIDRITLCFNFNSQSYVDINLYDMKPIDKDQSNFPHDVPADFLFEKAEYYTLKQDIGKGILDKKTNRESSFQKCDFSDKLFVFDKNKLLEENNLHKLYRINPIYYINANTKISQIVKNVKIQGMQLKRKEELSLQINDQQVNINSNEQIMNFKNTQQNGIIDVFLDISQLFETQSIQQVPSILNEKEDYPIFQCFEKFEGIKEIIKVAEKRLLEWENQEKANKWILFIQELNEFAQIKDFMHSFIQNEYLLEVLLDLLAINQDRKQIQQDASLNNINNLQLVNTTSKALDIFNSSKKEQKVTPNKCNLNESENGNFLEEKEEKIVKSLYKILQEVLQKHPSQLSNDFFRPILNRIQQISKENPRQKKQKQQEEEKQHNIQQQQNQTQEEEIQIQQKIQAKSGIGYASDANHNNQKWNINEYVEAKQNRSEQLLQLLVILEFSLDNKQFLNPSHEFFDIICQSSLLPLIESALRSGSLLDISKESELFFTYLRIIKVFSTHQNLVSLLFDLGDQYIPLQTQSIFTLISQLKNTADIFLQCLPKEKKKSDEETYQIAIKTEELYIHLKKVEENQQNFQKKNENNNFFDLQLSPSEQYKKFLAPLRFGYMSMKYENNYKHFYSSYISQNNNPSQQKIVRLAQELSDMYNSLPIDITNSIFVRCDNLRVDLLKVLITGSSGTPYGHGAFLYDVFFEDTYPQTPPKVTLVTTGESKVRFNPNLYSCGKVCLSLLGTWRGNASENWDPKISTLLQVLLSLQAIIMTEDVYFNEPGFEGQAGSDEGEKKNRAYQNIVKYCNIKFAMIDQILNPPKGFEDVIQRHFYIKKNEILSEVNQWIAQAESNDVNYTGLVYGHNTLWCQEFSQPNKYKEMLIELVTQLNKTLNQIPSPKTTVPQKETTQESKKQIKKSKNITQKNQQQEQEEEIDVEYEDQENTIKNFLDINDENVKDRWSRYICAMGVDSVNKQSKSSVFQIGLGPLGVEIAKNIILSGVKKLTIQDSKKVQKEDLFGQFFITEKDLIEQRKRVDSCFNKLQQLNTYVELEKNTEELNDNTDLEKKFKFQDYDVLLITEFIPFEIQIKINAICRKFGIKFISVFILGTFVFFFNDFGDSFEVLDKDGEETQLYNVKQIFIGENNQQTVHLNQKHNFEDGDYVAILDEKEALKYQNYSFQEENLHKISVLNHNSLILHPNQNNNQYKQNIYSIIKVKKPILLKFKHLKNVLFNIENENEIPFDDSLKFYDFEKIDNLHILHQAFLCLDIFFQMNKRLPQAWNKDDAYKFIQIYKQKYVKKVQENDTDLCKKTLQFLNLFSQTLSGVLPPLCAFVGGFTTQEIFKAITNKFMPTKQLFYMDFCELIHEEKQDEEKKEQDDNNSNIKNPLEIIIGKQAYQKIKQSKVFMVGCGAIGCELLKNFAMINACIEGTLTITDPDYIENSNLNRQFLFREKHIKKSKSLTAQAAVIQINPNLKGHVIAKTEKLEENTKNIFTDKFFEQQNIVANALDNVQARKYVDSRCVITRIPLLESGTLGPKGHVQVIIPYLTESYSSQADPQEDNNTDIPYCTLKMFPEDTIHCLEWARDKFSKIFSLKPKKAEKVLRQYISDKNGFIQNLKNDEDQKLPYVSLKILKNKPKNWEDCLQKGIQKFQKYFRLDIIKLLQQYPKNHKTKDNQYFWKPPKRIPNEINCLNLKNQFHLYFIQSFSALYAQLFNIKQGDDEKANIQFIEDQLKKQNIFIEEKEGQIKQQKEEQKEEKKEVQKEEEQQEELNEDDKNTKKFTKTLEEQSIIIEQLKDTLDKENVFKIQNIDFEKDNKIHIDFIYSLTNLRANSYSLPEMNWFTCKIKAGKIVPALASTTASIAGLQVIEFIKYMQNKKTLMRNSFLNLAVPIISVSEPGQAKKKKINSLLEIDLWERWNFQVTDQMTLSQLLQLIQKEKQIQPYSVLFGQKLIFSKLMGDNQNILQKKIKDLIVIIYQLKFIYQLIG